jgi:hypothetical protein
MSEAICIVKITKRNTFFCDHDDHHSHNHAYICHNHEDHCGHNHAYKCDDKDCKSRPKRDDKAFKGQPCHIHGPKSQHSFNKCFKNPKSQDKKFYNKKRTYEAHHNNEHHARKNEGYVQAWIRHLQATTATHCPQRTNRSVKKNNTMLNLIRM